MSYRSRTLKAWQITAAARGALARMLRGGFDFVARVYDKAGQDDIFFLAGGIAFNVLIAAIPFLLLLVAIFGYVLQAVVEDPQQAAVEYVISILPASRQVVSFTRTMVDDLITGSTTAGIFGLALLIWFSTRLIGSLRSALRDVFDLPDERGIVQGKIFDAFMVLIAGSLFLLNTGITVALEAINTYGFELLGVREGAEVRAFRAIYAQLLAFGFIFLMFVLMYRYLPARRLPWRAALVAGTFTAVVWEILKAGFAWYVASFANYASTYGYLATLIVLVFWIYYSAFVFVLGGEVGQVYELSRVRRQQRELLE
ncbi:YihY/virulence factor BrkB family protein [soil metagenome]|nr:YihY/virulence factor BrkB family protein [Gemmatimonadota bacterium]